MEIRRIILFMVLSMAIFVGWNSFIAPRLFPPQPAANENIADDDRPSEDDTDADEDVPDVAESDDDEDAAAVQQREAQEKEQLAAWRKQYLKTKTPKSVTLGSIDPESGYFLQASITPVGAAVARIELNDDRYRMLENDFKQFQPEKKGPPPPLSVVGNNLLMKPNFKTREIEPLKNAPVISLQTSVSRIDKQIRELDASANLKNIVWELVDEQFDSDDDDIRNSVTFRAVSPDGTIELKKRFYLKKYTGSQKKLAEAKSTFTEGYQLGFELSFKNLTKERLPVNYRLVGPAGLPLENKEHTRKYRDIKLGVIEDGDLDIAELSADDLVEQIDDEEVEDWQGSFQYVGVDVQYFAALLRPVDNQLKDPYFNKVVPVLIPPRPDDEDHADLTVAMESDSISLPPGVEVTHSFQLYAGPKKEALLSELGAEDIIEFGIAGAISKGMLWVLKFLHDNLHAPYWLAIILLTVAVRSCMIPLSLKQAASAQKMKDLQPKIAELRKKYENDKEQMARAQMELFGKHGYNPLSGCFPVLLQMPIFIGLYSALNNAVELRRESFLWMDNLAGPDALFRLPFSIPFLGADFNLLPIVTIALFIGQQKMFMPPPANEEQELQQKMMKFMMVFMGFLFYHVPSGLCVYFITSSVWGMTERKFLRPGLTSKKDSDDETDAPPGKSPDEPDEPKDNFWTRLLAKADAAVADGTGQTVGNGKSRGSKRGESGPPKKSGKPRQKRRKSRR